MRSSRSNSGNGRNNDEAERRRRQRKAQFEAMMWRDHALRTGRYKGIPVPPQVLEAIKAATLAHWERQARGETGRGWALWPNPTFVVEGMEWRVNYDGTIDLVHTDPDF